MKKLGIAKNYGIHAIGMQTGMTPSLLTKRTHANPQNNMSFQNRRRGNLDWRILKHGNERVENIKQNHIQANMQLVYCLRNHAVNTITTSTNVHT